MDRKTRRKKSAKISSKKKKVSVSREKKHEHPVPLSEREKIIVGFSTIRGKVTKVRVAYLYKINGTWEPVQRCDNVHLEKRWRRGQGKYAHYHFYRYDYRQKKSVEQNKTYVKGSPAHMLDTAIEKFKKNRKEILNQFLNSKR